MAEEIFAAHSPLGASSADRWMNCPGSYALLKQLRLPESDEQDYRRDGVAAHEAAAHALMNNLEGWELIGEKFHEVEINPEIANAVQTYLSYCRSLPTGNSYIEASVGATRDGTVNRKLYGTVDYAVISGDLLDIVDYKHGEGIIIEAVNNPQLMYYALAFLLTMPGMDKVSRVRMTIVQPRGFHEAGPVRAWETTAEFVLNWGKTVLMPAMDIAEVEEGLTPGKWCRFCPAKLVCPLMVGMFGAAATANPKNIPAFSNARLALEWELREAVRFYITALDAEVYRRLNQGEEIPGLKMVNKQASRVFKTGAEIVLAALGPDIYSKPELKSPAEIEKLGPEGRALVKRWAYTPNTGYTVAPLSDPKPGVKVEKLKEVFGRLALDKLGGADNNTSD